MAVHIIKISQGNRGEISVDPDLCVVEPGPEPSYILFVLDENLNLCSGGKPGFVWDDLNNVPKHFKQLPLVDGGKIILIRNTHTGPGTSGLWFYQASVVGMHAATKKSGQSGTHTAQSIRSERHPVIINK